PVLAENIPSDPNNIYNKEAAYIVRNAAGLPYGISNVVSQEIVNPLAQVQLQNGNYNWSHNLFGDAYFEIDPIKGLSIKTEIAGKQAFYGTDSYTPLSYLNASTYNLGQNSQY